MTTLLKPWTHPSNYMGASWAGWLVTPFNRNRDSGPLDNSNFEAALASLRALPAVKDHAGVTDDNGNEEASPVSVVSENHWACGWVEWIAIHPSCVEAVAEAEKLAARLESYPVLDEDDLSRRENEEAELCWDKCLSIKERMAKLARYCDVPCIAARHNWDKLCSLYDTGELGVVLAGN